MSSWPALFAVALAMWLVLRGPAAKKPSWVQRACRVATAFFAYAGFLYLLKWDPFWKLLSVDLHNRNRIEGFLILLSTLIWLIATLRALLSGSRFAPLIPASMVFRTAPHDRRSFGLSSRTWLSSTTSSPASKLWLSRASARYHNSSTVKNRRSFVLLTLLPSSRQRPARLPRAASECQSATFASTAPTQPPPRLPELPQPQSLHWTGQQRLRGL